MATPEARGLVSDAGNLLLWLTVILVRGAFGEGRYLYPFLDVPRLGYPTVALNALLFGVTVLLIALTAVRLTRRRIG